MKEKKELIYVTYTCKRCGYAFIDIDPYDTINDTPLKTRYCPDCIKLGHKNDGYKLPSSEQKIIDKINQEKQTFKDGLKENNIADKKDIAFLKKTYNKQIKSRKELGKKINFNHIFKEALELLSYQDWKVDCYE